MTPVFDDGSVPQDDALSVFDEATARRAIDTILDATTGGGVTRVSIRSTSIGSVKWARNFAHTSEQKVLRRIVVHRTIRGATGIYDLNRSDTDSLRAATRMAEALLRETPESSISAMNEEEVGLPFLKPDIWSDGTIQIDAAARSTTARALIQPAESVGFSSAGSLSVAADSHMYATSGNVFQFYTRTVGECSITVRHASTRASGWAGADHHDWARLDLQGVAATAIEKCRASASPRGVEPGRYTTILEPQAVGELVSLIFHDSASATSSILRAVAESGGGVFSSSRMGFSRLGSNVIDQRLTLSSDPLDPVAPFIPFNFYGTPYPSIDWIKGGTLQNLAYDRYYALRNLGKNLSLTSPFSYRLVGEGEPVDRETMIATTKRGLLVTRFSAVQVVDRRSLQAVGYTRDGVWLIENGKISHPVKNFQFMESPIFMLNNVEQIGPAVRMYQPEWPSVVPTLKVRDFNFVGLSDAV